MAEEKTKKSSFTRSAISEARRLMGQYRGRLAIGMSLMIVNRLAGMVLPASSKYLIDEVIGNDQIDLLIPLGLAVGLATSVQAVTTFSLSQVISVAAQHAIMEIRRVVQHHVIRLPVRFFDQSKSGELISRIMTDAEGIRNLVGTGIVQLVGGVFTAVLALVVLFYLNWQLTAITIFILATFGGGMAMAFQKLRPIFRKRREINGELTGRLGETLSGIRIVKAYAMEPKEQEAFGEGISRLFLNIKRSITGTSLITSFGTLIVGVIGTIMILVGGRAIADGTMSLGDFVMYILFTGLMVAPIIQMASIGTQISEAFAGLDRIREIMSRETEDQQDEKKEGTGHIEGTIKFEDVHFSYEENNPVLKGISFEAKAGTTTALVGSSGSGKSTLVSLVMAFNQPDTGAVLLDGRDLAGIKINEYRNALGVVMQENFLFDGTIAENIRFADPTASDERVFEVARIANCDDFVSDFPDGYETIVGERGVKLSGGQRQRVAIARALLADPRILVLDEATSSLDTESEALIQSGLRHLREGRTTFVIAHRLSTIRSADQILVIEDGKIFERGTHHELMAIGGRYKELHDRQHAFEENLFANPGEG
jgi:ABC-type multidrug transport system fused ATPase/permease subunit